MLVFWQLAAPLANPFTVADGTHMATVIAQLEHERFQQVRTKFGLILGLLVNGQPRSLMIRSSHIVH